MKKDLGFFFFGLGSVAYAVSLSLSSMSGGGGIQLSSLMKCRPHMIFRMMQAKYRKKENRQLHFPNGFFHLKGFMVAGTDISAIKMIWKNFGEFGRWNYLPVQNRPLWEQRPGREKGMYFFPDTAFYEFITEKDMMRNYEDPSYIPPTYLMDEVRAGRKI